VRDFTTCRRCYHQNRKLIGARQCQSTWTGAKRNPSQTATNTHASSNPPRKPRRYALASSTQQLFLDDTPRYLWQSVHLGWFSIQNQPHRRHGVRMKTCLDTAPRRFPPYPVQPHHRILASADVTLRMRSTLTSDAEIGSHHFGTLSWSCLR
jgi:hypothetical protein